LNNRSYDKLKWVATIVLPGLAALYLGLSQIWGFPYTEEIAATITVINTFLGILLGVSSRNYNNSESRYDGNLTVVHTPEGESPDFVLALNSDDAMNVIPQKNEVIFKVTVR
jgi:hypothetical protein